MAVTLTEAARILSALDRRPVSASQIRSILVLGTSGRAMAPRLRGDTRLIDASELACVRLNFRLRAAGVSATVARVVIANLQPMLSGHWKHGDAVSLVVTGLRGFVVPASTPVAPYEAARIELLDVWNGIEQHVQRVRQDEPEAWRWNRPVTAAAGVA